MNLMMETAGSSEISLHL